MSNPKPKLRRWRESDIAALVEVHNAAYSDYSSHYDARSFELQLAAFPEGQLLVEVGGRVVAYATSIIVQLDPNHTYSYDEITGGGSYSTHDPTGDTLYGADIAVHPDFRRRGLTSVLYGGRKRLLKRYNLQRLVAYGRLPGYRDHQGAMTAEEYVEACVSGKLRDPALSAHLKAGFEVKRVVFDLFQDPSSMDWQTYLEMPNPEYRSAKRRIAGAPLHRPVRRARVCAAQYLFRRITSWSDIAEAATFFVDVADEYHCHFLLLPELFTMQLLCTLPEAEADRAAYHVAEQLERYRALFSELAHDRQLYIIAGSTLEEREGRLYNVAHLFTPSGKCFTQDKLHITPSERREWNVYPGRGVKVFASPFGRFGIQVCYDVEFPELSRLQALAGAETIYVPFSTDDRKAYQRVRFCAAARAIENYVYVVIAGNVGNLPSRNYLINYGQAAILTPSDVAFPLSACAGEGQANMEGVALADLDFEVLLQQREAGSVRPLRDRRPDLYALSGEYPVEVVHVS